MESRIGASMIVMVLLGTTTVLGQIDQRWVARYGGTGDQKAYAAAADDQGCVYVTGDFGSGSSSHMITVKYGPCGNKLWETQPWSADYETIAGEQVPRGIVLDAEGVYVRGAVYNGANRDFGVMKYSRATGAALWSGPAGKYDRGADDWPVGLAVGCGGVYLVGYSSNGADWDYLTVKFGLTTGAVEGVKVYGSSALSDDYGWAVAVDETGVYVTGGSWRGTMDFVTIKYDCGLTHEIWNQPWDSPAAVNPFDFARAIALGCNGYVFVTGECGGNAGEGYDYGTVAYDRMTGAKKWEKRYNNEGADGDDYARDVVATSTGVYVTGRSQGSGTDWDYATIKYSCSDGAEAWGGARRYDNGGDDEAMALTVCDDGVYVTGRSEGSGTGWDYATIAYDPSNGNTLWSQPMRYDAGSDDKGQAVAAYCGAGVLRAIYVTGLSSNGSDFDYATVKYGIPPSAPTLGSPADGSINQPTCGILDWTDVSGVDGYDVQISTSCGSGTVHNVTDSQYYYADLLHNKTYYWRVRSRCGNPGPWSSCYSFTTSPALSPPNLQSPADGATGVPCVGKVCWSAVPDATGYQVQIGTICGKYGTLAIVTSTCYRYNRLELLTTYYWRVRTMDACGSYGDWSGCYHLTTADYCVEEEPIGPPSPSEDPEKAPSNKTPAPSQDEPEVPGPW